MDDKLYTTLLHLSGLILPIAPVIMWIIKKDESAVIDAHGKEAANWQLTIIIALILTSIITVGLLTPFIYIMNLIFCIIAAVKANEGKFYKYPFYIKIFK